jgi:hypothetical protein
MKKGSTNRKAPCALSNVENPQILPVEGHIGFPLSGALSGLAVEGETWAWFVISIQDKS